MHTESTVKANRLGVEITRKTKRLGCSGIKDLLENNKLDIHDEQTILECSTFEARGQSYEASDGNHDDLIMNLVMFGYFINTDRFRDLTDINIKEMLYKNRISEIENDIPPFGFMDTGEEHIKALEERERSTPWAVEYSNDF